MKQPVLRPLLTVLSGVLLSLSVACSAPAPGAAAPGPAAPAAASAASPAPAAAANPYAPLPGTPLEAIRVGVCAVSGGFIQLYTALEGGVFPRYGLEVELVTIRGSGAALAALSSNEIQFLYCAADATIPGLASGAATIFASAPLARPRCVASAAQ